MALRGTLTHWKTRTLADLLAISPAHALGLLEALFHTTAEDAPSGNIGRLPNKAIAMQMFTDIDPDRLISALVTSGYLDEHPKHRLLVHDWHEHADYNTKRKVARYGGSMFTKSGELPPIVKHDASSPATDRIPVPEPGPSPEPGPIELSVQLASEIGPDLYGQIVERMFSLYCTLVKRDPGRYTLTRARREKATARLKEREKISGSLESAADDLETAIRNLSASEFHISQGHYDWEDQIFRSQNEFEKRLNWTAPKEINGGAAKGKAAADWEEFKREECA